MKGPPSAAEQRGYGRGYRAGRRRQEREGGDDASRARSALQLFELLVEGLVLQGFSLDAILDAQIAGAKARQRVEP